MGNWIQGAHIQKGALHASLGVQQGQRIPAERIASAASSDNPTTARRARLAQTLAKIRGGK